MTNKYASVIDYILHRGPTSSVVSPHFDDHRKTVAGRVISILAVLGFLSFVSPSFANVGAWTYAGQNYATQAAALAAMHAVSARNALLTKQTGISGMTASTVTYQYGAPPASATKTPYWYCVRQASNSSQSPGGCWLSWPASGASYGYATEQQGIQAYITAAESGLTAPCSTQTVTSGWAPIYGYPGNSNGIDAGDSEGVTVTFTYNGPTCNYSTPDGFELDRYLLASCPTYYSFSNNQPPWPCVDTDTDTISYQLLECPANGSPSTYVGDPCDVLTGDFSQTESDYSGAGLTFKRYYHSAVLESHHSLGVGWTDNYSAYLVLSNGVPVGLLRPNGHHDALLLISGAYVSLSGAAIHVQASGANWIATLKDGSSEVYDSTGRLIELLTPGGMITTLTYNSYNQLISVSSPFGQALQFGYNTSNQLQQLIDSAGKTIFYAYDTHNNLMSVTYQDGTKRTYLYEDSNFPNNLTGIIDESGSRFLTVGYDSTTGAVRSSQQAGGAQAVSIVYNTNTAVVTDSLGATSTYTFTNDPGFSPRVTGFSHNSLSQSFTVPAGATDAQRRVTQSTDAKGNITTYAFDANHLTSKTEAYGTTAARTTSYQYLSTMSALPTLITEPLRQTSYAYFAGTNNVQTKTITDVATGVTRTWNYTYNSYGQVLTIDGPRTDVSDVTTYTYYTCTTGNQCGQIDTITNALGQVTTFNTYNAHGQPLTITDPNGVVMTLTYDARERLTSRQVGSETTSFSYYPIGLLQTVTMPDGSTVQYTYDGAHRLTDITDGLGNHIHYTLDAMDNRTTESSYDPSGTLHRTHTRVINSLNEIYQDINAAGTAAVTTTFGYDSNGNLTTSDAPLSRITSNQYDALNRLTQITDPASGVTQFSYDANDNLASAKDPRSLTTSYTHNGFGDVTQQVGPDTGTTTNTYDSGGNLQTATDARGAVATYTYDALNRVTQVAYPDQVIHFTYDAGTNGIGRLTGAADGSHTLSWSYDALGRVIGKGLVVGGVTKSVGYGYTNGDLVSLITPSGQSINYGYTGHRITSITINGTALLSGVTYEPFGSVNGWTWGNGQLVSRSYDADGYVNQIATAGETLTFGYDDASRITSLTDTLFLSNSYAGGYDLLDRVTSLSTSSSSQSWTYDANGNRLTQSGSTSVTATISPTSNQLMTISGALSRSYGYDAAGNTTSYTGVSFVYNQRGRMSSVTTPGGTTNYIYDALGQLIEKSGAGGTTILMYDEAGHLIGEYDGSGNLIEETIWMGDTPVATLRPNGSSVTVYYVHTDHLNAPRVVTQASNNAARWLWGGNSPNQNPLGLGTFVYNLRYPGQYYQAETGLYYNYFRDYDPVTARYVESDPIGLHGGINTYSYAGSDPIANADFFGLCAPGTHPAMPDEINKILNEANKIQKKGLTHAQVQCNQFVNQAIDAAFPGAFDPTLNTRNLLNGPVDPVATPSVGDLALLNTPGHVVFITGVSNGQVTQFLGSQTSSGPAYVNLGQSWWDKYFNPPNVTYLQICLPD